ncbi:hypothetical protein [Flavobacterium terrisoli]|uniref:hypothetical protein n=1 Tax=Flavobacterium terrisoli TaxID=3242195 RepID=UPI002542DC05|nr:hypothetical protein [Flavobacterium buctense]
MLTEISKLVNEYPTISLAIIAAIFSSIGWGCNSFYQVIVDNYKQKRELKIFLWKEKINAAKKASEFYLEYLNFINLLRNQLDMLATGKAEYEQINRNIDAEIQELSNKLKTFPHFEHHHINIFYNLIENRTLKINQENFEILGKINGLGSLGLSYEEFDAQLKDYVIKFKNNYSELAKIYEDLIEKIRADINSYL